MIMVYTCRGGTARGQKGRCPDSRCEVPGEAGVGDRKASAQGAEKAVKSDPLRQVRATRRALEQWRGSDLAGRGATRRDGL
jgi:hypothetical protein